MNAAANDTIAAPTTPVTRQAFLRDVGMFHGKLLLFGICDLLLFPAALIAVALDFVKGRGEPDGRHFYSVVNAGKAADRYIDLFAASDRAPATVYWRPSADTATIDGLAVELEAKLKTAYDSGELSTAAQQAVERVIAAARRIADNSAR